MISQQEDNQAQNRLSPAQAAAYARDILRLDITHYVISNLDNECYVTIAEACRIIHVRDPKKRKVAEGYIRRLWQRGLVRRIEAPILYNLADLLVAPVGQRGVPEGTTRPDGVGERISAAQKLRHRLRRAGGASGSG